MARGRVTRFLLMGLFISAVFAAQADPKVISVHATPFNLSLSAIRIARDSTIPFPYLGFSFSYDNRLFLNTSDGESSYFCIYTENFGSHEYAKKRIPELGSVFRAGDGVSISPFGIGVLINTGGVYDFQGPRGVAGYKYYYYANKQLLVFGDGRHGRGTDVHFIGYLLNERGVTKTLSNDEFLEYIKKNNTGFSIRDGILSYKGIKIEPESYLCDDSGNWYHFATVFINGVPYDVIDPEVDAMTRNYQAWRSWDIEGNLWYLIYPKSESDSARLMYVGRDWGYIDKPEIAKCKIIGAPLLLRAKQDAFLLGTLKDGEQLTVLKKSYVPASGSSEQWCRVKTEAGLVGWTLAKNVAK